MQPAKLPDKLRKLARSLHAKKYREQERLFIAEGEKAVGELLKSVHTPVFIVLHSEHAGKYESFRDKFLAKGADCYEANERDFHSICDAQSPQGIVALVPFLPEVLKLDTSFIALDSLSDPGNAGTIIRTAHFFGVSTILLDQSSVDLYNPKLVRATMGSLFYVAAARCDLPQVLINTNSTHTHYGAVAHATQLIEQCAPRDKFGLVIGSESHGISSAIRALLHQTFQIPGSGGAESLNASVAAGICLYHFSKFL